VSESRAVKSSNLFITYCRISSTNARVSLCESSSGSVDATKIAFYIQHQLTITTPIAQAEKNPHQWPLVCDWLYFAVTRSFGVDCGMFGNKSGHSVSSCTAATVIEQRGLNLIDASYIYIVRYVVIYIYIYMLLDMLYLYETGLLSRKFSGKMLQVRVRGGVISR